MVDGELPSFVTYAANARDKMRQLYSSIVVVGRHDGFAKGFEKRAQIFLDALANHTQKVPLASYEIVFVDYATPTEAAKLSEVFVIHPVLRDKIRFVNVPATSHVRVCHKLNTSISFLEYVAKNIGIRRAKEGTFSQQIQTSSFLWTSSTKSRQRSSTMESCTEPLGGTSFQVQTGNTHQKKF